MGSNPGRPKREHPLDHDIKVRVDDQTNQRLLRFAGEQQLSRTEVIRRAIHAYLPVDTGE